MAQAPGSDEITEQEFDELLDAIDARKAPDTASLTTQAAPGAQTGSDDAGAGSASSAANAATSSDEITEEEFDALLDKLDADKNAAGSTPATSEAAGEKTDAVVDEYLTDLCTEDAEEFVITLEENVRASYVAEMHTRLLEVSAAAQKCDGPIRICGSKVESIDTAGVQLVYALIKDLNDNGRECVWSDPSEAIIDTARLLGMCEHLNLQEQDSQAA